MTRIEIKFNHSRQSVVFHIHSETLAQFRRRHKCDAWFLERRQQARKGVFGYIHLPNVHKDDLYMRELVAHEVQHLIIGWVLAGDDPIAVLVGREEQIATMTGEIVRKFWSKFGV